MNKTKGIETTFSDRLISVFASLFFSIPTCALLSLKIGQNLFAIEADFTIGGKGFVVLVSLFSVLALVFPKVFPNILGWIWKLLVKH